MQRNYIDKITKPKLVFFQWRTEGIPKFVLLHRQQHIKCLSEFFEVTTISEDCDYQQICDKYQPDIALFESGVNYASCQRPKITNTSANLEIPKVGFHNGDSFCGCRSVFLSDMEHWGIETFFSICTTTAEYTPEIAENLFVWPNFVDADIYRDYGESKTVPVLFTGRQHVLYPWRQQIIKIVSQHYPSLICPHHAYQDERTTSRMIYGEQYARMLNASWVVPTCGTMAKEVVRKHFEISACKSCLITERTSAVEACGFVDMQNCVFADESDVLDKLDYLFQHPDEIERITNAGYQLVHSRHTLKQRDQIFQWFNLYKVLKPNQRIVQKSPFDPLTVVEKSSGIKNSHVISNGLDRVLLGKGDEKLWAGKYDEAEALYLSCLNYLDYIPEPKLRLALCNLYKGDAVTAFYWISQLIKYSLEDYKALDPDPVEWAYLIISLLCQGKLNDAVKCANQFPLLCHPELDRVRSVIAVLKNRDHKVTIPDSDLSKRRSSVHQLPTLCFKDWIYNLCNMLKACQQFSLAETLSNSVFSRNQSLENRQGPFDSTTAVLIKDLKSTHTNWSNLSNSFAAPSIPNPKLKLLQTAELEYIVTLGRWLKLNLLKQLVIKCLRRIKATFSFFLISRLPKVKNDEFFSAIQKLAREEDIKTALVIGASAGEESTEAFVTGIRDNQNKPTVFCVEISTPQFVELQKRYANDYFVRCHNVSSVSLEQFPDENEVVEFYNTFRRVLNHYPLDRVLGWLRQDIEYIKNLGIIENGIKKIKQENKINFFDVVLINSSDFTSIAELDEVYGASFVLLDAISTFQNYKKHRRLLADPNYTLVTQNPSLHNGYAIFKKVNNKAICQAPASFTQELSLVEIKYRSGSGKVRASSFRILNEKSKEEKYLQSGKDYYFEIGYLNNTGASLSSVIISLDFFNEKSVRVLLLKSNFSNGNLALNSDKGCITCRLKNLPLANGLYRVSICLSQADKAVLDWIEDAASVTVDGGDLFGTSSPSLPSSCKILSLAHWFTNLV